jgi:hypothetical protein
VLTPSPPTATTREEEQGWAGWLEGALQLLQGCRGEGRLVGPDAPPGAGGTTELLQRQRRQRGGQGQVMQCTRKEGEQDVY